MEEAEVEHKSLLEEVIAKGNDYLKIIGLKLDSRDRNRKFFDRLRFRPLFIFTFFCINLDVFGQLTWLVGSFISGSGDLIDVTFLLPCLTVSLMGSFKTFYFLKYAHNIHEIINTLKNSKWRIEEDKFEKKCVHFLNTANKIITLATILGITAFGVGPLLITAMTFYKTGEIKLFFPFLFYYPFNAFDIRVWPFLYAQQLWSAVVAVCAIWGPDYVCYGLTTFIIIHFFFLKQDIVNLIPKSRNCTLFVANADYKAKFRKVVQYHNGLLRCVQLMEATYTKTILFNVITSSMLICFNVFNITATKNIVLMAPYTAFLAMVLGQIFLLCYYGDIIMRASAEVSDAIYRCRWYGANSTIVKDLIMISLRANRPSKLTAYGFSDVNLRTFTKILSTSWSYLALLQTVYDKNQLPESPR